MGTAAKAQGGCGDRRGAQCAPGGSLSPLGSRGKIQKIFVPVDFSDGSKAAYELALDLAEQYDARVKLLHVVEDRTSPDFETFPLARSREQLVAKVKNELVGFAKTGSHPVVPVYPEVRAGSPWEQIVEAAADDDIDLIIIPTNGYTGIKRLVIGSVAERVVRHAPCPVLALRKKQVDFLTVRSSGAGGHSKKRL